MEERPTDSTAASPTPHTLRGVVVLAVVSGGVATLCDLNHVFTETLSYPQPTWFGQPWWSGPAFIVVFAIMTVGYLRAVEQVPDRWRTWSGSSGPPARFAVSLGVFAAAYLASGWFNEHPAWLAAGLYGTFLVRLAFSYERVFILGVALALAVGGVVGEGSMTLAGIVAYREPEVFGVPIWLGAVYAHGALALREGVRAFVIPPVPAEP